jgi:YVTN family beta-propeller protein
VANRNANTVSVIDAASNTVIATVPLGVNPEGVAARRLP